MRQIISGQSRVLSFVFGALSAVFVVVGYRLWVDVHQGFPTLADGRYLGVIQWQEDGDEVDSQHFILQIKGLRYSFSLPEPQYQQFVGSFVPSEDMKTNYYPLQIQGGDYSYLFHGERSTDKDSRAIILGGVSELNEGTQGEWKLFPLGERLQTLDAHPELHLALVREEQYVEQQIEFLEEKTEVLNETIQSLETRVSSRDELRTEADNRYKSAQQTLENIQSEKAKYSAELEKVANQLELARKVTSYGEVIRLARQAAQYDEQALLQEEGYSE